MQTLVSWVKAASATLHLTLTSTSLVAFLLFENTEPWAMSSATNADGFTVLAR